MHGRSIWPRQAIFFAVLMLCVLVKPNQAHSFGIGIGTSTSPITGGRLRPGMSGVLNIGSFWAFAHSAGVKTRLYYHSGYTVHGNFSFLEKDWGIIGLNAGAGWGAFFAEKGLQSTADSKLVSQRDFLTGPSAYVFFNLPGPFYISMDCLFGITPNMIFNAWGEIATLSGGLFF